MQELQALKKFAVEEKRNIDACLDRLKAPQCDWAIAAIHIDITDSLDYCYIRFAQGIERYVDLSDISLIHSILDDLHLTLAPYSTVKKNGRRNFGTKSKVEKLALSVSALLEKLIAATSHATA